MDTLTLPAGLLDATDGFLEFPDDLAIPPDLGLDLDFEFDPSFSLDDLLDFPDVEEDPLAGQPPDASDSGRRGVSGEQMNGSFEFGPGDSAQKATVPGEYGPGGSPPQATGSNGLGSGVSSSSPSPGNMDVDGFATGDSATCSMDRVCYATGSPDSGNSAIRVTGAEDVKDSGLKRKSERDDDQVDENLNAIRKLPRRSHSGGGATSSHPSISGTEDEKRKARLIRNRESAQLSRQRRKLYVEELEEKIKVMNSTIADLSNRISYFMAENAGLRQQLSSGSAGNSASPLAKAIYPAVPMQYPWMPWPGYTMTPGSQVPLVPIPKLRTQQPTPSISNSRARKKGVDSKTKKVAGVSLVGLLFFILVLGACVRSIRHSDSTGQNYNKNGGSGQHRQMVLSVTGNSEDSRLGRSNRACDKAKGYPSYVKGAGRELERDKETSLSGNASEPLLASLYVPRNDKLVKIDGNLIISSVLATERARTNVDSAVDACQTAQLSGNGGKESSLAIPGDMFSALAVVGSGRDVKNLASGYGRPASEPHKAKEWFRQGMEGPLFRSGLCTEVFQFDASLASGNGGGLLTATSIVNVTNNETIKPSSSRSTRNRRILSPHPVQLAGHTPNNTKGFSQPSERSDFRNTTTTGKPIIVSVLVDPREGVDEDVDSFLSSKSSISRIFVVVLVDSVKYITYSCMLPHKNNGPHLVTV